MKIKEGSKVLCSINDKIGKVKTIYPEVDIAIVKFDECTYAKVRLQDLTPIVEETETIGYEDNKKKSLLDKIRGTFK